MQALDSMQARGADAAYVEECRSFIRNGVSIDMPKEPPVKKYKNSGSIKKNLDDAKLRIQEYIQIKAVEEVGPPKAGESVHPLLMVKKPDRKPRICVDLARNLNDFVKKKKFKLQAIREAVLASKKGCWYGKMDLSNCFLSFPLSQGSSDKLRFSIDGKHYKFTSVPFGLTSAPRIVSYLLDVVSAIMTDCGAMHIRYLDDFLFIADSKRELEQAMVKAARILEKFGLCNNLKKLEGPSRRMEFLGIVLDSIAESLYLPEHKMDAMKESLEKTLAMRAPSLKHMRSLLGKFAHLASVLPAARPFTRALIDHVYWRESGTGREGEAVKSRRGPRRMSGVLREDLKFWAQSLQDWNGSQKWSSRDAPIVVASDASTSGFGWVVESAPAHVVALMPEGMRPGDAIVGIWSEDLETKQSVSDEIGWGEMYSPAAIVSKLGEALRDSHIVFVLDNSGDTSILNRRRTKDNRIAELVRYICKMSVKYNFAFTSVHRPGAVNCLPDVLSRKEEHKFELSVEQISKAVDRVRSKSSKIANRAPPPEPFEYGQFFLRDPVSLAYSSVPVLYPSSVTLLHSTLDL
jgi:hypothetical protein